MNAFLEFIQKEHRSTLWVADEHVEAYLPEGLKNLECLSNRCDVVRKLKVLGYHCHLSDFAWPANRNFERVCYRISKEKAVVHHLINQAMQNLPVGGELCLWGEKGEGIKTYASKAGELIGADVKFQKRDKLLLVRLVKAFEPKSLLPDDDYPSLRKVDIPGLGLVYSKPGIFGWKKADQGSALLVSHLEELLKPRLVRSHIVDLGCGYGYLAMHASRLHNASYVLTDNSITALAAASANLPQAEFVLADAGDSLPESSADLVLCNPPFHSGFDHNTELTSRFLRAARRVVRPRGEVLFVVNQHIGLVKAARANGLRAKELETRDGFSVFLMTVGG